MKSTNGWDAASRARSPTSSISWTHAGRPMASEFTSLFDEVRKKWAGLEQSFAPVASEAEIAAFERRHGLTLPPDLRAYFAELNGLDGAYDDDFARLLPLAEFTPLDADRWGNLAPDGLFVCAEQGVYVMRWGVQLRRAPIG